MPPDQSLPVPMPREWRELLEELGPVFARRSTHRLFMALACGLILADRGTVTGMAAAAGIGHQWRRACWFFADASWDLDALGLAVARLIVKYLLSEGEPLTVVVDGTFFRRWRTVAKARWACDGAAQGGKKIAFGNTRVVAALVVRLPFCPSPAALPATFRLWRGKGTDSRVELAAQMVKIMRDAFPGREVHGTGDAVFHGKSLVIEGTTWTTRLPANAGAPEAVHELVQLGCHRADLRLGLAYDAEGGGELLHPPGGYAQQVAGRHDRGQRPLGPAAVFEEARGSTSPGGAWVWPARSSRPGCPAPGAGSRCGS